MNRTQIEWARNPDGSLGYIWNPITGCLNHYGLPLTPTTHINGLCKGGGFPCYAYRLAYGRLKSRYLANPHTALKAQMEASVEEYERQRTDPFYPRFWEERLYHPWDGKPKGIFVCDMSDLFGIGIPEEWTRTVLELCRKHKQNRYYLLTKQPQNLPPWSPFPENCWVGVTATNGKMLREALTYLEQIEARVKFVSLEPLLSRIYDPLQFLNALPDFLSDIDWLIIGACTGTWVDMANLCLRYRQLTLTSWGNKWTAQPRIHWVQEIVQAADKAGIKVFLKDNLKPLLPCSPRYMRQRGEDDVELRQEMPR